MKLDDDQQEVVADLKTAVSIARKIFGKDASPETVFDVHDRVFVAHDGDPDLQKETMEALEESSVIASEVLGDAGPDAVFGVFAAVFPDLDLDEEEEYEEPPPPKRKPKGPKVV